MSLITQNNIPIEIEIPDLVWGLTTIKRKIVLQSMIYNQIAKSLTLSWVVKHYSKAENNTYGDYLGSTIPDKKRESIADNMVMVTPIGEIIQPISGSEVLGYKYDESITRMGQYDWFYSLGEAQDINVHNLIRSYGQMLTW